MWIWIWITPGQIAQQTWQPWTSPRLMECQIAAQNAFLRNLNKNPWRNLYPKNPCMAYITDIYPKIKANVGKYTLHGWYGWYGIEKANPKTSCLSLRKPAWLLGNNFEMLPPPKSSVIPSDEIGWTTWHVWKPIILQKFHVPKWRYWTL